MLVGTYILPTSLREMYKVAIEDIYKAAAVAVSEWMDLMLLGHLHINLCGVTNSWLDLLHRFQDAEDR